MIREKDSRNEEEDDAQKCPSSAEHQKAPRIRDTVVIIKIAELKLFVNSVAVKHVDSVAVCSHDDDGEDELQRSKSKANRSIRYYVHGHGVQRLD